jgi:tRNA(Ile)-lysidine synthase TilS/MesJ
MIKIIRPMLDISKSQITEFANQYNIPYLYDSTPKWCERGRIRDILVPSINQYDKDLLQNLVKISKRFKEIYNVYENLLLTNTEIIKLDDKNYKIKYIECYDLDYWKLIFMELYKSYDITIPSIKSLNNFIENLKIGKNKMVLTKEMTCIHNTILEIEIILT